MKYLKTQACPLGEDLISITAIVTTIGILLLI